MGKWGNVGGLAGNSTECMLITKKKKKAGGIACLKTRNGYFTAYCSLNSVARFCGPVAV